MHRKSLPGTGELGLANRTGKLMHFSWATCLKDSEMCPRSQPSLRNSKGTLHLGKVAKAPEGGGMWMDGMLTGNSRQSRSEIAYEAEGAAGARQRGGGPRGC